jgi:aerobic-type carbon monoxide dehydrogenase small subunit (CoxS/CutS family)
MMDKGGASEMELSLNVNGQQHRLSVDVRMTLLDALREVLGLTGAKRAVIRGNVAPALCFSMDAASSHAWSWPRL